MQAMREVLEACPYGDNDVYLHTDPALMPVRRATWASWNFLGASGQDGADAAVCVSYWVNNLQASSRTRSLLAMHACVRPGCRSLPPARHMATAQQPGAGTVEINLTPLDV